MYYSDINKNKFLNLDDYYIGKKFGKIKNKSLLNSRRLIVLKNKKVIYMTNNIQSLYLYPLSILDYVKYAYEGKTLMYNILSMKNNNINLKKIINSNAKNIEFLIDKENIEQFNIILEISRLLKKADKYVSYNLKTLNISDNFLKKLCFYSDYIKIKLNDFDNGKDYQSYLNRLIDIKKWINKESLIHVKGYLNINQIKYYEMLTKDTKNIADIIQISKELMPINCKYNPRVDKNTIRKIRNIEKTNKNFISVKNIETLYYPRFELDERNSHKCYVWYLKPYIKDNYILPCKVNKVINNIQEWKVKDILSNKSINNTSKYGKQCDDCASIFENDTIFEIINFYENGYDFLLEIDEK